MNGEPARRANLRRLLAPRHVAFIGGRVAGGAVRGGAEVGLGFGVAAAAVLGIALVCELWWIYFDIVSIANVRRLVRAPEGAQRNEMARDVYSYLHFPLVAGIVISAFGLHETLAHVEDPLPALPAFALLGGVGIYLLGHVAVRLRGAGTLSRRRLFTALLMFALIPLAAKIPSLATLAIITVVLSALIVYETISYGEGRGRIRYAFDRGIDDTDLVPPPAERYSSRRAS